MKIRVLVSAAALSSAAGLAVSAPVIDGQKGADNYGAPLWTQNQPTSFGDNLAGTSGGIGTPELVRTGFEFAIPLSALGSPANGTNIKLAGFINGAHHDYLSNQVIGGTSPGAGNLENPQDADGVNFVTHASCPGDQYISLGTLGGSLVRVGGAAPTMDGSASGADNASYGAAKWVQTNITGFGNNNNSNGINAGGSEIDGVYAFVWDNGTAGNLADDLLYVVIAGNVETNGNDLELFFDTVAGGQNHLLGNNAIVDVEACCTTPNGGLNRMGDTGSGNGITFDAGFDADFWVGADQIFNSAPTDLHYIRVRYATLPTAGAGTGYFVGRGAPMAIPSTPPYNNPGGALTGGDAGAPVILASLDNSNTAGVSGGPITVITRPNRDYAAGSEIDAIYATIDGNYLYVLVTGNLEDNSNPLELFFDVDSSAPSPEGQNRLRPDNVDVDYSALRRMGSTDLTAYTAGTDGLVFDTGFTADYWLSVKNFGYPIQNYGYASVLRLNGPLAAFDGQPSEAILDYSTYDGGPKTLVADNDPLNFNGPLRDQQDFSLVSLLANYSPRLNMAIPDPGTCGATPFPDCFTYGAAVPNAIEIAIDNNNIGGVTGAGPTSSVSGAASASSGVEFRIRLDELGWNGTDPLRIAGFIGSNGRDFVSNQILGGIPGYDGSEPSIAASLGDPRLLNLTSVPGTQYVIFDPTPACPADLSSVGSPGDPDGGVDINDLLYFLAEFESGSLNADLSSVSTPGAPDGGVDINDLLYFLEHFEGGC